jgi:hypothetical protein
MSITLRDAQHLSWKTFKKFEAFNENHASSLGTPQDLTQKVNELSAMDASDADKTAQASKLLSKLLFSVFIAAERSGVSLEDSFLETVDEIILGFVS